MKKKTLIIALLAVVAVMGIGFSILSNHLSIQGTAKVNNDFDVEIVGIKKVDYQQYHSLGVGAPGGTFSVGTATEMSAPTYTANTATFDVKMGLNSTIVYLVTIENKGSIDAVFKNITINKSEDSDVEVELPIDFSNKHLLRGKKAYMLVKISYTHSDDLKGNDSEISVEFDAQQATESDIDDVNYYLTIPGQQYSSTYDYPIEVVGLESINDYYGSQEKPLRFYVSVDGEEYVAVDPTSYPIVTKFENFGGINWVPDAILNDGQYHEIKIKLYNGILNYYTNEITINYRHIEN